MWAYLKGFRNGKKMLSGYCCHQSKEGEREKCDVS